MKTFSALFPHVLEPLWCGYVGVFNIGLFTTDTPTHARLHRFLAKFQFVLNAIFRILFRTHGAESAALSPYLFFIGKKR
jgi:hypothetical protein